jgi:hypothetical protein
MKMTRLARNRRSMFVAAVALAAAFAAQAEAQTPIESRWNAFQADPIRVMNQIPPKSVKVGKTSKLMPLFSKADVKTGSYITKKNDARIDSKTGAAICDENGICLKDVLDGRALAKENVRDFFDARDFVAKKPVLKLDEMETENLRAAELAETPWSDTYWPIYQGILGSRYANSNFGSGANWKGFLEFVTKDTQSLKAISEQGNALAFETLSPSEKYDLLIGDLTDGRKTYEAGYLTPFMWDEGKAYWDQNGDVEAWMGICHGWAPAAFMVNRPTKSVTTPTADGKNKLTFYPSDIKGLASYLWAKTNVPSRFIGGRCNDKDVKTDPETGRPLSEACFDTNPANWHQIIVNQIGVAKRSFVMDATFDYEVWNQPVYSYSYKYFNPQTGREVKKLSTATIPIQDFTKDKFKKFRSPRVAYVVGISMDVTYVVETSPSHNEVDSPDYDSTNTASYMYDLELDKNMNIIGGEWYSNAHPDFLWSPVADGRAISIGDSQVSGTWDARQPLPKFWRDIAVQTATRAGLPLAAIVESLIETANQPK